MTSDREIRIVAVGDVMLGDSSHFIGRGVGSCIERFGANHPFANVADTIAPADLFFANLESPLARQPGASAWERVYRGPARAAAGLQLAATNVVSIANNHMLEHGQRILAETRAILAEHDIDCAGYDDAVVGVCTPWRGRLNDLSVSLFADSLIREFSGRDVDPARIQAKLIDEVSRDDAQLKIVSVHWGDEYVGTPAPEQATFGRRLIDAGARLVLGHHPHVLQPIEEYGGGLIAYSLGNFVFDQDWGLATRGGGLLRLVLSATGIREWEFIPTLTTRHCQPTLASGREAVALRAAVAGPTDLPEPAYRALVARNTARFRLRMKWELLRHFWRVTPDTLRFLATKRKRPRPVLD